MTGRVRGELLPRTGLLLLFMAMALSNLAIAAGAAIRVRVFSGKRRSLPPSLPLGGGEGRGEVGIAQHRQRPPHPPIAARRAPPSPP